MVPWGIMWGCPMHDDAAAAVQLTGWSLTPHTSGKEHDEGQRGRVFGKKKKGRSLGR